jgi:hypothetical protein
MLFLSASSQPAKVKLRANNIVETGANNEVVCSSTQHTRVQSDTDCIHTSDELSQRKPYNCLTLDRVSKQSFRQVEVISE